jgi:hypothetical protein
MLVSSADGWCINLANLVFVQFEFEPGIVPIIAGTPNKCS